MLKEKSALELQSKTIDFLRFPLALMVVFIHNPFVKEFDMQSINYADFGTSDFYVIIFTTLKSVLSNIAVPSFFMFSGFLFFFNVKDFSDKIYINKIKKRVSTLFVPYILWCLVPIGISFVFALLTNSINEFWNYLLDKGILNIFLSYHFWHSNVFNYTNSGPALLPLWFLRDLILVIILSPLVFLLIKHTKFLGVLLLGLLYFFKVPSIFELYNVNQLITALFFFSLGAYFSIYGKNLVLSFRKLQSVSYVIAIVSFLLTLFSYNTPVTRFLMPVFVISGIIAVVNLTSGLIENKKIKSIDLLAQSSFFVYLCHSIFIFDLSKYFFDKILPFNNYYILTAKFLLTPLLCTAICVSVYYMLKRFFPKFTAIITGGR